MAARRCEGQLPTETLEGNTSTAAMAARGRGHSASSCIHKKAPLKKARRKELFISSFSHFQGVHCEAMTGDDSHLA